jgi:peptide/nickel transport system permease protein
MMIRLFLRRAGFSVLALLLVSLILFVLMRAIPASPARMVLGFDATEEQITQFDSEHGLDRPVLVQYVAWLRQLVFHGDLGKSLITGLELNRRVAETLPVTLELVVVAFSFSLVLSIALGTVSAFYEGTAIDQMARVFAILGLSVPGFWLALLLILFFAVDLQWFPPGGIRPLSAGIADHLSSLVLPAFSLGVFYIAILSRMTRSSLVEVLGQDYIRTARATGLGRGRILVYALKNALVPVVTVAAMSFGYMFGWALIIETVFNISGMSGALLTAIYQRDFALVQAVVLVFTLVFLVSNLIADLVNAWLNPRIRTEPA